MPMVQSYFRRSAGQAGEVDTSSTRMLDVSIYDLATGNDLLRWRGGGRTQISGLSFSTGLPGGFLDCSFTLSGSAGRLWPIDSGQKVEVKLGAKTVWFGWVEDIARTVQGSAMSLQVTCIGPWQICQQRLVDSYTGGRETSEAVRILLLMYAEAISSNMRGITATGVTDALQSQQYASVADVIKQICATGNSSFLPMLFAIWEPNVSRLEPALLTNLVVNGSFEQAGSGNPGTYPAAGWNMYNFQGWDYARRWSDDVYDGFWAMQFQRGWMGGPESYPFLETEDFITVVPLRSYAFSIMYTLAVSNYLGTSCDSGGSLVSVNFRWYDVGDNLLSTDSFRSYPYPEPYDIAYIQCYWQDFVTMVTAPTGAVKLKLYIEGIPWCSVDRLRLYEEGATAGTERKPQAFLWPRDLSDFDYYLYTAAMPAGFQISETTRALANAVIAQYETGYTTYAQDAASQTKYRRRDAIVDAGAADATIAQQVRAVYLARYKDTITDVAGSISGQWGVVLNKHGRAVQPLFIRAGDRLKVMDGPKAGTILMLDKTSYSNGVVTLSPESGAVIAEILAKGI